MKFSNPNGANGQPLRAVWRMLREPRAQWPQSIPVQPVLPSPISHPGEIRITFVGHSTFLIESDSGNILTDPVYSDRASPLSFAGPRRVRAPAVRFDDLPEITQVLVSHNHYDHCDIATLRKLHKRFAPAFVTTLGNAELLRRHGIARVEELDWWQETTTSPIRVTATQAQHFSSRGLFDRNRTLWAGFVIRLGDRSVYFAGDSGYGPHFSEIHRRLGQFDISLLPIGAYEPRWFMRDIHMNPAEAVQAHIDLESLRSVGMHFGTFQLTTEAIDAPARALAAALVDRGIAAAQFVVPEFGATITIGR